MLGRPGEAGGGRRATESGDDDNVTGEGDEVAAAAAGAPSSNLMWQAVQGQRRSEQAWWKGTWRTVAARATAAMAAEASEVHGEGDLARGANWEASRVRVAPGRFAGVLRSPGSRRMAAPWSIRVVDGTRTSTALR